jgi:hypothetical protein
VPLLASSGGELAKLSMRSRVGPACAQPQSLACTTIPSLNPADCRCFRVVRGMVPHKSARGAEALKRLKVFEGVPPPYDKVSYGMSACMQPIAVSSNHIPCQPFSSL